MPLKVAKQERCADCNVPLPLMRVEVARKITDRRALVTAT